MHADRVIIHACAHTCVLSIHPRITSGLAIHSPPLFVSWSSSSFPSFSFAFFPPLLLPLLIVALTTELVHCSVGPRGWMWSLQRLLTARAAPLTARAGGIRHEAEEELLHEQYSSRMLFVVHGPHSSCDRRRRRPHLPPTLSCHRPPRLPCSMRARSAQEGGYDI